MTYGSGVPVVKVGRIAGQFAKPRSSATEIRDGVELPSFRGHIVNDPGFSAEARQADPNRLVDAYHQSAAALNLLRAFTKGGFADLTQVHAWNQEFVAASPEGLTYEVIASEIERALRFMAACGIDLGQGVGSPPGRLLDVARGAAARLGGGADPPGQPDRRLVRLLRPPAVDRRADPGARRRPRRVPVRGPQPGRGEARADGHRRGDRGAVRPPRPRPPSGSAAC